jgi:hypothetical protein
MQAYAQMLLLSVRWSMTDAFCLGYLNSIAGDSSKVVSAAALTTYLGTDHGDKTFANNVAIWKLLIALKGLSDGIRLNNVVQYDACRLNLVRLCFALGHSKYGPIHVLELLDLYFQMQSRLLEYHAETVSFGSKALDERLEETNRLSDAKIIITCTDA